MAINKEFLIERKLKMFEVIATTSIAWWVSIVVFEATIVSVMYLKGDQIEASVVFYAASFFGILFISLSVFHGLVIYCYFRNSHRELKVLLKKANLPKSSFNKEFKFAKCTVINGTGALMILWLSFIGVCCLKWIS